MTRAVTMQELKRPVLAVNRISRFHYLTHDDEQKTHAELARAACEAGVRWIQFRKKEGLSDEVREEAIRVQNVCKEFGATFIVNDRVGLAYELGADGVHLGREDMPWQEAREALGPDAIIGGTANRRQEALELLGQPIDYVGVGPFRFTETKRKLAPLLGAEGISEIAGALREAGSTIPVIAIGGIGSEDLSVLLGTGVYGVAVSSAIGRSPDPRQSAAIFIDMLQMEVK